MPITKALPIKLSNQQDTILQQIVRGTTNPYRLVRRAKLILAAASGESNSSISRRLELDREQVALWRERWWEGSNQLSTAEQQQATDKKLMVLIEELLSDRQRSGTKKSFTVEQVVQIVAIACESPEKSNRPISHWTPSELASEATKRGYERHGTLSLIANWDVARGKVLTPSIGATRTEEDFALHIQKTIRTDEKGKWIFIVDQLNTSRIRKFGQISSINQVVE